jgi:hypothetical protein
VVKQELMSSAGVFCLCALVLLVVFATFSARGFPEKWNVSQIVFETFAVLAIALVLSLGILITNRPAESFPAKTMPMPALRPKEKPWWFGPVDDPPKRRIRFGQLANTWPSWRLRSTDI